MNDEAVLVGPQDVREVRAVKGKWVRVHVRGLRAEEPLGLGAPLIGSRVLKGVLAEQVGTDHHWVENADVDLHAAGRKVVHQLRRLLGHFGTPEKGHACRRVPSASPR